MKKWIIQQNIYGVDIEQGAVDIARLRFWLALVVDAEKPEPLPNLHFKIMQGNSLLETYCGKSLAHLGEPKPGTFDFNFQEEKEEQENALAQLYNENDHEVRAKLMNSVKNIVVRRLIDAGVNEEDLVGLDVSANSKFFLWHTWFHDVFSRPQKQGFDIVIGNPPYIKEYTNSAAFNGFRESSPYYIGKMDLWHGFACHGLDFAVDDGGVLCFIAQNNWTTNAGAKKLRDKIVNDCRIVKMLDFNDYLVFGGSASIQTMIMLFVNDNQTDVYSIDYRRLLSGAKRSDMVDLLNHTESAQTEYFNPIFNRDFFRGGYITFSKLNAILEKIAKRKECLWEK